MKNIIILVGISLMLFFIVLMIFVWLKYKLENYLDDKLFGKLEENKEVGNGKID